MDDLDDICIAHVRRGKHRQFFFWTPRTARSMIRRILAQQDEEPDLWLPPDRLGMLVAEIEETIPKRKRYTRDAT